ncbi:MAG: hypothetical protein AAF386_05845 [Pseudomonadota bacterium]
MFKWWSKRRRFEHIKLAKQNALAAEHLLNFQSQAIQVGSSANFELVDALEQTLDVSDEVLLHLKNNEFLEGNIFDQQFGLNRDLRRLYDEVLAGRKQAAKLFGNSSEKLESFDSKFVPNAGWKFFISSFDS